ncbi:hypothetical protein [Spirosoma rhododendri]|uniref:Tetratricopeptide repeat protein n=1 Tax=Spirosoma rhododendri TaxID=2728024 RepID=A0A7L5DLG9_9BACT|nr:hypothetical protein [Spirosoma rhododendri]QJD77278.1 hypothetical protein HH216_01720 [Spirosoma rhododendri]
MKTLIITLFAALLGATAPTLAQSPQYKQAMTDALTGMNKKTDKPATADILASANQFERIAGAESAEWLPRYYAGLNYVYLGFLGGSEAEKDKYLDQADVNLKAAETISPKNDELAVLKAYIAQARLTVDAMNRWQQYGPLFQAGIEQAKAMNPANPCPYVLEGSSLMYTPAQFGGGPDKACPVLKQAMEKLATFKPASEFAPGWGKQQIEPLLTKCK